MHLRSGTTILSGAPFPRNYGNCSSKIDYQFKTAFYHLHVKFEMSRASNDINKRIIAAANLFKILVKPRFRPLVCEGKNLKVRINALQKCREFMDIADDYYTTRKITRETYEYLQDTVMELEIAYKNYL